MVLLAAAVAWLGLRLKRRQTLESDETEVRPQLEPGWYAQILGENADLADWKRTLNKPFDPVAIEFPDDHTVLKSREFDGLTDADEVRSKALILIARLNGALRLSATAEPVRIGSIINVDADGCRHITTFMEAIAISFGRMTAHATAVALGSGPIDLRGAI